MERKSVGRALGLVVVVCALLIGAPPTTQGQAVENKPATQPTPVSANTSTMNTPSKGTAQAQTVASKPATETQSALRGSASYTIDVTVVLSSTFTQGSNRIMVELRQGAPGASEVVDTQYFEGQTGTVRFSRMSAGPYFIAIGNGDSVAVGPVRQFSEGQSVHTSVRVTQSSGNVGTRSRSSL